MVKRGLGKKGQELTISTLVIIVLGIAVLVLLILGFTKGWDFIFGKFDISPGSNLEAVVQSCNIAIQGGLKADFCSFKRAKIDGTEQYLNCKDDRLKTYLEGDYATMAAGCPPGGEMEFCKSTIKESSSNYAKIPVNGKTCQDKYPVKSSSGSVSPPISQSA